MKSIILGLSLLTSVACTHSGMGDRGTMTPPSGDNKAVNTINPRPNTGYDRSSLTDPTVTDPEGDLAPMVSCSRAEVERRQSGKVVCVPADRADPNKTMTGR